MDKLNADGNTIGRIGALLVIALVVVVVGRVCGGNGMCPVTKAGCCMFSHAAQETPAAEAPAAKPAQ